MAGRATGLAAPVVAAAEEAAEAAADEAEAATEEAEAKALELAAAAEPGELLLASGNDMAAAMKGRGLTGSSTGDAAQAGSGRAGCRTQAATDAGKDRGDIGGRAYGRGGRCDDGIGVRSKGGLERSGFRTQGGEDRARGASDGRGENAADGRGEGVQRVLGVDGCGTEAGDEDGGDLHLDVCGGLCGVRKSIVCNGRRLTWMDWE